MKLKMISTNPHDLFPESAIHQLAHEFFEIASKIANNEPKVKNEGLAISFLLTSILKIANQAICHSAEILNVTPEFLRENFVKALNETHYEMVEGETTH